MNEIAFAVKSCFAGIKSDGFDFMQRLALEFHLNEEKISSWLCHDCIQQKKRERFGYQSPRFLFFVYRNIIEKYFGIQKDRKLAVRELPTLVREYEKSF